MRRAAMSRCCGVRGVALFVLLPLWAGCVFTRVNSTDTTDVGPAVRLGEMDLFLSSDVGFFPCTWAPQRKTAFMGRMQDLHYHNETFMGMTLVHARMEMPVSDLDDLLSGHKLEYPKFGKMTHAQTLEHAFGSHSQKSFDDAGQPIELAWWQPGGPRHRTHYSWSSQMPSGPPYRTYVQVERLSLSTAEIHVRIEGE